MNLKMKGAFILFLSIIISADLACQEIEFKDPVLLPPQINSLSEEIGPMLSRDGKKLYFVRAFDAQNKGGKRAGMDIWYSSRDKNGKWSVASNKLLWNNSLNNAVIGIRKDNKVIYLLNSYNKRTGIAFSVNQNEQWTTPEVISIPGLEKLNFVGFYMNAAFNTLIISMVGNDTFGQEDLYVSLKDSQDQWSIPLNLGSTVNTEGFESAPFLSEDGKKLYFTSNGHKGLGEADIFVCERLYDNWTVWSRPKNLGDKINSPKFDSYFSVYGDSLCFFTSNRASDFSDIYQSKIELKKRVPLKDSVNKIIDEAKRLLVELKAESPASTESISFLANSSIATDQLKIQLRKFVARQNLDLIERIEVVSQKSQLNATRDANLTDYLVQLGVEKAKISSTNESTSKSQDAMELRVFLKKKK
jgi:WD40-like Beta Propeller Repeat